MNSNIPQIKNLIFSGGGAAGVAFAGAVDELAKQPGFSLAKIENVAGTSIGSIAALMVSLNYTPAEVMQTLTSINLKKLEDGGWFPDKIARLYSEYGMYKGAELYKLILDLIKFKTGRADPEKVTFADLQKLGCKNLFVIATKLYTLNGIPTGKRKLFSTEKTPGTAVATAILASCAAPYYFQRVRLKKVAKGEYVLSKNGDLYNDGGIVKNLALDLFDKGKYVGNKDNPNSVVVNPASLGLSILATEKIVDPWHIPQKGPIADASPIDYGKALFNTISNRNTIEGEEKFKYHQRTVQIDRLGVTLAQFDMDEKTKLALVASGRLAVQHYYEALNHQDAYPPQKSKFAEQKVPIGRMWQDNKVSDKKVVSTMKPEVIFVHR